MTSRNGDVRQIIELQWIPFQMFIDPKLKLSRTILSFFFDYSNKSSNRICLLTSSFSWRMYVCFQRLPFIWIIYSCQQCLSPTISNIDGKSNKLSSNACVQNRNPSIISSIEACNGNRMCLYLSSAFQSRQWQATKSDKTTSLMLFDLLSLSLFLISTLHCQCVN